MKDHGKDMCGPCCQIPVRKSGPEHMVTCRMQVRRMEVQTILGCEQGALTDQEARAGSGVGGASPLRP